MTTKTMMMYTLKLNGSKNCERFIANDLIDAKRKAKAWLNDLGIELKSCEAIEVDVVRL